MKIKKVLIANRGEIAIRIMRTCRRMGIETVAIFSDSDRQSFHLKFADTVIGIGGITASDSYLVHEKILDAAKVSGADAIHPGYGFLSENAQFALAVENAGLTFIGPNPDSIVKMGEKTSARQLAASYGVPLAPGSDLPVDHAEQAIEIADRIGYPVLIKAAAGGGGKGMRIIHSQSELPSGMKASQNEAQNAFGNSSVYIEKYLENPRHIEFQILADNHGHCIHLFERECSIQRRHQKVIEEAPSSILTHELRQKIGDAAIQVAKSCQYTGAGTVEFLLDKNQNFYFLEMNTRLQVEHPVTEMITGLDLVEWQIRVANGEVLPFQQAVLTINGHAVECRIYAENPKQNFLPDTGRLIDYHPPSGPNVRIDAGVCEGSEIGIYFDPLIAKLCTWGHDRNHAISQMDLALSEYEINGLETTIPFCRFVMNHEAFLQGNFDTHFVQSHFHPDGLSSLSEEEQNDLAIAGLQAYHWMFDHPQNDNEEGALKTHTGPSSANMWKVRRR